MTDEQLYTEGYRDGTRATQSDRIILVLAGAMLFALGNLVGWALNRQPETAADIPACLSVPYAVGERPGCVIVE